MNRLLGIDVGTSAVKALVFEPASGEVTADARQPLPTHHPRPEWTEYDPEELWETVCRCLQQLWEDVNSRSIDALAVASMAEAGLILDSASEPTYPIIAWHDPRTKPQADWLREQLGPFAIYRITGQHQRHIFSLNKLLWLRQNEPDSFAASVQWLCVHDYVIWRLTEAFATDRTIASRTLAYDQGAEAWSEQMLETAGLKPDLFPPVFPSGTAVGRVTDRAAEQTGLRAGTAVCTGGHDHLCGAFAAGMVSPGQVLDSSGTAQAILTPTPAWRPSRQRFESGFTHYRYVVDEQFILQMGLPMAGGLLRWVADLLSSGREAPEFNRMMAGAEAAPAGARGVTCLPYLQGKTGPDIDPAARGAFIGLTPATGAAEVMRAALEGLAYHLREVIEALENRGVPLEEPIIAIGGTTQGELLSQIKADVTGYRLSVPEVPEEVALGAALLAGLGVGGFNDPAEAAATVPTHSKIYEPNRRLKDVYDRRYGDYRELYRRLSPPEASG